MAKNLGRVTAYAHAKAGGYTGTQDEFNAMLAGLDEYNEAAAQSAEEASGYAEEASGYVTEASGYADNASESASAALDILGRLQGSERARYWKHYDVTTQTTDFAFNPTNYSYSTGDDYDVYVNGEMLDRDKVMIHTTSYGGGYNVTIIIDGGISGAGNPDKVDIFCYKDIALSTDDTLTEQGAAADAKATGDAIDELKDDLEQIVPGLSAEAKEALLACFDNVAWANGDGQDYYDALRLALYPDTLQYITASLSLDTHIVFMNDSLDSLKDYLTVTAFYGDGTSEEVTDYTLSGDISSEGTHVVTVTYSDKTANVNVPVTWGYRLKSPEIAVGGIVHTYRAYDNPAYFDSSHTVRYSNKTFLAWETGYDCYVEADTALDVVVSVNVFNQLAMNSVNNHQNISADNLALPGWASSNPSLSVIPDTINNNPTRTIRVTFKKVPTDTAFSTNDITEVRITRRAK